MDKDADTGKRKQPIMEFSAHALNSLKPFVLKIYDRATAIAFMLIASAVIAYVLSS